MSDVNIFKTIDGVEYIELKSARIALAHEREYQFRLEKKLKQYESGYKGACPTCEVVGELNVDLEKKLAKAVDGLKFYADKDSWVDFSIRNDFFTGLDLIEQRHLFYKGGKRARQFLRELEGDK